VVKPKKKTKLVVISEDENEDEDDGKWVTDPKDMNVGKKKGVPSDRRFDQGHVRQKVPDQVVTSDKPKKYVTLAYRFRTMLTLDQTTLFYFSLRDASSISKDKHMAAIKDWAKKVPPTAKPTGVRSTSTPSLTNGFTGTSRSVSSRSALTNQVKISRRDDDVISIADSEGALSDRDERKGPEREAAVKSPPKGNQRVTSAVSI
jgi:hypothetical protein